MDQGQAYLFRIVRRGLGVGGGVQKQPQVEGMKEARSGPQTWKKRGCSMEADSLWACN